MLARSRTRVEYRHRARYAGLAKGLGARRLPRKAQYLRRRHVPLRGGAAADFRVRSALATRGRCRYSSACANRAAIGEGADVLVFPCSIFRRRLRSLLISLRRSQQCISTCSLQGRPIVPFIRPGGADLHTRCRIRRAHLFCAAAAAGESAPSIACWCAGADAARPRTPAADRRHFCGSKVFAAIARSGAARGRIEAAT